MLCLTLALTLKLHTQCSIPSRTGQWFIKLNPNKISVKKSHQMPKYCPFSVWVDFAVFFYLYCVSIHCFYVQNDLICQYTCRNMLVVMNVCLACLFPDAQNSIVQVLYWYSVYAYYRVISLTGRNQFFRAQFTMFSPKHMTFTLSNT